MQAPPANKARVKPQKQMALDCIWLSPNARTIWSCGHEDQAIRTRTQGSRASVICIPHVSALGGSPPTELRSEREPPPISAPTNLKLWALASPTRAADRACSNPLHESGMKVLLKLVQSNEQPRRPTQQLPSPDTGQGTVWALAQVLRARMRSSSVPRLPSEWVPLPPTSV